MSEIPTGLEVAVVPDFCGENPALFEARTLFFLASWLERSGKDTAGPDPSGVRLCCVGEPPASVRRLAERAGAKISVHPPVANFWGGFANKLRGLEDVGPTGRRLVVDADVLVLGSLEPLQGIDADVAAAVAGKPQVPLPLWERLYAALDLPLPEERVPSLRGRLELGLQNVSLRYEGQQAEAAAMLPYYNSGVLLVRGDHGLRARWEEHMHRILQLATGDPEMAPLHALMYGDQVGLATALQSLRAQNFRFAFLPDSCHVRLAHLRAGALRWRDIRLFHATGFLRGLQRRPDLPALLEQYATRWAGAMMEGAQRHPEVVEDAGEPPRFLQALWEQWVRPAWEAA